MANQTTKTEKLSIGASDPRLVSEINSNDVLFGRGATICMHPGNVRFRDIVQNRKPEYVTSSRRDVKKRISSSIIDAIRSCNGRFLRPINNKGSDAPGMAIGWMIASAVETRNKVQQALRELKASTDDDHWVNATSERQSIHQQLDESDSVSLSAGREEVKVSPNRHTLVQQPMIAADDSKMGIMSEQPVAPVASLHASREVANAHLSDTEDDDRDRNQKDESVAVESRISDLLDSTSLPDRIRADILTRLQDMSSSVTRTNQLMSRQQKYQGGQEKYILDQMMHLLNARHVNPTLVGNLEDAVVHGITPPSVETVSTGPQPSGLVAGAGHLLQQTYQCASRMLHPPKQPGLSSGLNHSPPPTGFSQLQSTQFQREGSHGKGSLKEILLLLNSATPPSSSNLRQTPLQGKIGSLTDQELMTLASLSAPPTFASSQPVRNFPSPSTPSLPQLLQMQQHLATLATRLQGGLNVLPTLDAASIQARHTTPVNTPQRQLVQTVPFSAKTSETNVPQCTPFPSTLVSNETSLSNKSPSSTTHRHIHESQGGFQIPDIARAVLLQYQQQSSSASLATRDMQGLSASVATEQREIPSLLAAHNVILGERGYPAGHDNVPLEPQKVNWDDIRDNPTSFRTVYEENRKRMANQYIHGVTESDCSSETKGTEAIGAITEKNKAMEFVVPSESGTITNTATITNSDGPTISEQDLENRKKKKMKK